MRIPRVPTTNRPSPRFRPDDESTPLKPVHVTPEAAHDEDRVALSPERGSGLAPQVLLEETCAAMEDRLGLSASRWKEAGRDNFQATLRAREDLTPASAAALLLQALDGYLFHAWRFGRAEVEEVLRSQFSEHARAGLEEGQVRARQLLHAVSVLHLDPDLEGTLEQTAALVDKGIAKVFPA